MAIARLVTTPLLVTTAELQIIPTNAGLRTFASPPQALQQPIIHRLLGDALDGFRLDAAQETAGPVGGGEGAASDAVNGERAAIVKAQVGAAITALPAA